MDQSCYRGEYKKGKKHGYGTYQWTDGSKYQGQWEDNCLNGFVIYYLLTKINSQINSLKYLIKLNN